MLRIELRAPGTSMTAATISRHAGERFWGFGIRSDAVERTAGVIECWVGEGPYQVGEYPLVEAITPRWAIRRRRDAAYFPIPWVLSSGGFGLLVDNTEYSRFRFAERGSWSVEVLSGRLVLRLFAGPAPTDALRRFTLATGRQPYPVAPWFLGPWCQTGHSDMVPPEVEEAIVATLIEAGAPVSAIETHMRRLPAGAHEDRREQERARTRLFHEQGLASLTYLNPFVSEDYAARFEKASSLLQRRGDGSPYLYPAYAGGREPPIAIQGQLDFTRADAALLFAELAREALEDGHDGWMEDFGEYTPLDSISGNGVDGETEHNVYPVSYHAAGAAATADAGRAVARFGRSGWTSVAHHLPLVWGGDPTTGWGFDGLGSSLVQALNAGLSGIAFFGVDIGGFFTLGDDELDAELLIRWIQLGAMCPLMRTKAEGVAIPPRERPQIWDPDVLPHWRRWARFHTQLSPYLLHAAAEYVETGMPLMRHLCLVDPGDPAAARSDQYLLGESILVAPVLAPGAREREVLLPSGLWIDLWRSAAYNDVTGAIELRRPVFLEGGRVVNLPAPLDEIPLLVRAGTSIPMLPPDTWSLADPQPNATLRHLDFPLPGA